MTRPRITAAVLTTVLFAACIQAARGQEKTARPEVTPKDVEQALGADWYGVYLAGKKVGHGKVMFERGKDDKAPSFVASIDLNMAFLSEGVKTEMRVQQSTEFDSAPPFALRRATLLQASPGGGSLKMEVIRAGNGFDVTQVADGMKAQKKLASLDYTLTDDLLPRVWLRLGPKVGDTLENKSFDMEQIRVDKETRKVLATKTSLSDGVKVTYHEVEMTSEKIGVPAIERYDSQGRLLSAKLGGAVELRLEPEELAKQHDKSVDLFVLGVVKIDKPLGDPTEVTGLVIEIAGEEAGQTKSGPRQSVARTADGKHICKTGAAAGGKFPASEQDAKDYVAEAHDFPISHEKVQALAKKAIGDAKTPQAKVERLVSFVNDYIKPNDKVRPDRVLQLIEVRKGACTEYALLFATLARAAGIPAHGFRVGLYGRRRPRLRPSRMERSYHRRAMGAGGCGME